MKTLGNCLHWSFVAILASSCNSAPPVSLFTHIETGRIANDGGASRGVAWGDVDRDGDPDLVVSNTSGQWNAFYLNQHAQGQATFNKMSESSGPFGPVASAAGRAEGASWVDYDGDGDLDLHMVTRGIQPDLLFENRGAEGLHRIADHPLTRSVGSSMACWADIDGDEWLDVFIVSYRDGQPNALFRNVGGGEFQEITDTPLRSGSGNGRACAWGDPNGDMLPDLYVGNSDGANYMFWNRGNFVFDAHADPDHLVTSRGYTYGLSWADFDGDGDQDLFVASFDTLNVLYENDGRGNLTDYHTLAVDVAPGGASKGHAWGDYDLDGSIDLFVANGTYGPDMRNFLFLGNGDGTFTQTASGALTTHADTSAGAAWADYDRDGDLDLFVANWGSSDQVNRFYHNNATEQTGRAWAALCLRTDGPNTHAWGARVELYSSNGQRQVRWNIPTTGYGSQNEQVVHFGLGTQGIDSVAVQWTPDLRDVHSNVPANAYTTVRRGGGLAPGCAD